MAREFLGRGFPFPIVPDAAGGLSWVEGEANVEQSLEILLLTRLGERVMRPSFGCDAPRLVFAPGSVRHLRQLEVAVREAVRDWEPRVEIDDVVAEATAPPLDRGAGADETYITVSISYRVRPTNTRLNLVFPFYLDTLEVR